MLGKLVRSIPDYFAGSPAERFSAELKWWEVAGFIQGAYFHRERPASALR
jgi:hypothetical protein